MLLAIQTVMKENEKIHIYTEVKDCIYKDEHYSVRDNGAVFRQAKDISKPRKLDKQWLFGTKNEKTGYMTIGTHRVHIIVATAFHGKHDSTKDIVDHIDTNRCNNRPENLRWMTRLENALNNPATRKKIEYLCGGNIQKFIDNPSCLRDLTGTNQDVMWMRTVTKEEARAAYERVMKWAEQPSRLNSHKGSMGEWLFTKPDLPITKYEPIQAVPAISPSTAMQRNWKTPTEFLLCPTNSGQNPLALYLDNLRIGEIITRNKYSTHIIDDFALCNEKHLMIICHSGDEDLKKFSSISITFEEGKYVHEGTTYFEKRGAQKALVIAKGLKWDGPDGIDDYC